MFKNIYKKKHYTILITQRKFATMAFANQKINSNCHFIWLLSLVLLLKLTQDVRSHLKRNSCKISVQVPIAFPLILCCFHAGAKKIQIGYLYFRCCGEKRADDVLYLTLIRIEFAEREKPLNIQKKMLDCT